MAIILGSGSPRRRELLEKIGILNFAVSSPEVDETYPDGLSPAQIVCHLSAMKSRAIESGSDDIVITADTMVFLDDKRLGKPADEADALAMLTALQGRRHTVCTGVTVRCGGEVLTEAEETAVIFRSATEEELLSYIRSGEPMDKAGAYGIQGLGSLLVEGIEGDFFNVMGLPLLRLSRMLKHFGVTLL
ncbi:MAG: septum formation protein Maf [Oscillospiraceae bacterium]|nr:septum formation protein Maf [Oscillospiraceae bacterium]